jgi:tetratricopeptide (TPR) repeat protein
VSYKPAVEEEEPPTTGKKPPAKKAKKEEDDDKPLVFSADLPCTRVTFEGDEPAVKEAAPVYERESVSLVTKSPEYLNSLLNSPYTCNVQEIGLKDGAAVVDGEGNVVVYATYTVEIDTAAFLQGQTKVEGWYPLRLITPSPEIVASSTRQLAKSKTDPKDDDGSLEPLPTPDVFISLTLSSPLVSKEEMEASAVVTVSVEALESLPAQWLQDDDLLLAALRVKGEAEAAAKASGGKAKPPGKKSKGGPLDYDEMDKCSYQIAFQLPKSDAQSFELVHRVNSLEAPASVEAIVVAAEDGEAPLPLTTADVEAKAAREAQRLTTRVVPFRLSQRTYMTQSALATMLARAKAAEPYVVTVARDTVAGEKRPPATRPGSAVGGVRGSGPGYAGQAVLSFTEFLAEGRTMVANNCDVRMAPETVVRVRLEREARAAAQEDDAKGKKKGKGEEEEHIDLEAEPDFFASASTRMRVTVTLSRPLVAVGSGPSTLPEDIIDARAPPVTPAPTADEDFDNEVRRAVEELAPLFADIAGKGWTAEVQAHRQKEIMYRLNKNGGYHELKERLKPAIVRVLKDVREQRRGQEPLAAAEELTVLHGRLVDQMHLSVNRRVSETPASTGEGDARTTVPVTELGDLSPTTLKMLADEAELNGEGDVAVAYHERRVKMALAKDVEDIFDDASRAWKPADTASHWYDYAAFCLRVGKGEEAERCLREAVAINPRHAPSLLAYGMLMLDQAELTKAEVFVRMLSKTQGSNYLVRVLEGLYLEVNGDKALSLEAYTVAARLHRAYHEGPVEASVEALLHAANNIDVNYSASPTAELPKDQLLVHAARYLLLIGCTDLAQRLLDKEIAAGGGTAWLFIQQGLLYRRTREAALAEEALLKAGAMGRDQGQVIEAFSSLAHVQFEDERAEAAAINYTLYLDWEPAKLDRLVLVRMGGLLLSQGQHAEALNVYLRLCQTFPCCSSFMGAGKCLYALRRLPEAIRVLSQANKLNPCESRVWGLLTMLMLETDDLPQAKRCVQWAADLDLTDADMLLNMGGLFLGKGLLLEAKATLGRALIQRDDERVRVLLGDVALGQRHFEEQLSEYTAAASMCEDPVVKADIEARVEACRLALLMV